jgi:hypothetical protein
MPILVAGLDRQKKKSSLDRNLVEIYMSYPRVAIFLLVSSRPRTAFRETNMTDQDKAQGGAQGQKPGQQQGGQNPGQHGEKGHGENQPNAMTSSKGQNRPRRDANKR